MNFVIDTNSILGNMGIVVLHAATNAISTALYILQKENKMTRHIVHIMLFANKILANDRIDYKLNRAETISLLYHSHQYLDTITMTEGPEGVPVWSIRNDIFENLCAVD